MAERDLAVVAGEHVQPEQRDRVDQHQRELEQPVVAHEERQRAGEQRSTQRRATGRSWRRRCVVRLAPRAQCGGQRHGQTRGRGRCRTGPTGRTTSTPTMIDQRDRQLQLGADDVGADQVLDHADDEAADHRAARAVDAAQQRAGEGVEQDAAHHVRIEDRRSARPSCRRPRRSPRPAPSRAPASSRRGCRPAGSTPGSAPPRASPGRAA